MKDLFYLFLILSVILVSPVSVTCQLERHKIQPYINPIMIKVGNVSSQYTTFSNDFMNVDYRPFIFEAGLNYKHSYKHWSWILGIAQIYERHSMRITFPSLNNDEYSLNNYYRSLSFSSNFLGLKAGFSRQLCTDFRLNFNFTYEYQTTEGLETLYTNTSSSLSEQKYKPFLMPEISIDYCITSRFMLSLGFRTQFWSNPDNYRFEINMSGYIHAPTDNPEPDSQLLHSSRITQKGYYVWFGFKYDITINANND
jgi:hypothetical protein